MKNIVFRAILSVMLFGSVIVTGMGRSRDVNAAQWLAPAAADRMSADWVKQIQADLTGDRFRDLFMGIPADPPIPAILHLLNNAAYALADNKKEYAKSLVDEAIGILDSGIRKGWYHRTEVEPVKAMIRKRAEAALEGKALGHAANPRWSGYSDNKLLGLTDASGEKQQNHRFEDAASGKSVNKNDQQGKSGDTKAGGPVAN